MVINMIHLQGVGKVDTIKVSDLKVNDVIMSNFGITETVISFGKETAKFIEITFLSSETNTLNTVKYKKDKQVCRVFSYGESL